MTSTPPQLPALKLSICITTFNRAGFIGETLESILPQLTKDCEVVVLDGASIDDTEGVVWAYTRRFDRLRYIKQQTNSGIDRDYDRVVELACGDYCWRLTVDDLLKPGAVTAVLEALRGDLSLVIVNAEVRNLDMSQVLQRRRLDFESDRLYGPGEMDRLFVEAGNSLTYIGGAVIKRSIWLARERQRYYDSFFIHVGVIFQRALPGQALVIAEPYISYRIGNAHTFLPRAIDIQWVKWPSLVASLVVSESAKRRVGGAEPWRHLRELLLWRALGLYSLTEYRRLCRPRLHSIHERLTPTLVALLPGVLANALCVLYYAVSRHRYRGLFRSEIMLYALRTSRFHVRNWRAYKRESEPAAGT